MAIPRALNPGRNGDPTRPPLIPGTLPCTGRPPTTAEAKRRSRAGHRSGRGNLDPVWAPVRNGLPVKLYRYQGSGADAYTGEVVEL